MFALIVIKEHQLLYIFSHAVNIDIRGMALALSLIIIGKAMIKFLYNTISTELISRYIEEEINANAGEIRNHITLEEFEKITPAIVAIIRLHFEYNNKEGNRQSQKYLIAVKKCYREILRKNQDIILSLHLNFLILFNHLQTEAKELGDHSFENLWSLLIHDFIEISLSENNKVINKLQHS